MAFEAASEFYFSKPAKTLTISEAATLAGLPKSPASYSPITHPDRALKRRNLVINSMLEDGKVTAEEAILLRDRPLELKLAHESASLAPWFVEEIRRYLESKYGSDQVHEGGLRVYTSLNTDMQRAANHALLDGLARLRAPSRLEGPFAKCGQHRGGGGQLSASRLGRRPGNRRLHPRHCDRHFANQRRCRVWPLHRYAGSKPTWPGHNTRFKTS